MGVTTTMYNKLFTKILDSSIWLESAATRLVWLTMIAAMDEEGHVQFASIQNLAHRARVPLKDADAAVKCLESPDPNSSDPDNEGRRIERVPGGWMILNAPKYRDLVTRTIIREKTRLRVAKFRAGKGGNACVTPENVTETDVTIPKREVTPSRADTRAERDTLAPAAAQPNTPTVDDFIAEVRKSQPTAEDSYIRNKYYGKAENGFGQNWRMFAHRVGVWWAENQREQAAKKSKEDSYTIV